MSQEPFRATVHIAAPPDEVFPYLTDPELLVRWMGDWADLEPVAGGRFAVDVTGMPMRGEYLSVEPSRRVVLTWGAAGSDSMPAGSTTVEITLHADGDGTRLELLHHGLPPEQMSQHEQGWGHFLERLVVAATGGDPGPDLWSVR